MRRRGVRAVVAAMRLNKECQDLRHEQACHLQETKILREYINELRSLNKSLRQLLHIRKGERLSNNGNHNSWNVGLNHRNFVR